MSREQGLRIRDDAVPALMLCVQDPHHSLTRVSHAWLISFTQGLTEEARATIHWAYIVNNFPAVGKIRAGLALAKLAPILTDKFHAIVAGFTGARMRTWSRRGQAGSVQTWLRCSITAPPNPHLLKQV